jgi:hypothetical protein
MRRTRLASAAAMVAAVAVLALAGCGSDTAEISPSAAADLDRAVEDVRVAIDGGDVERARELLDMMRTTVVELATTGGVTGDRALEINQAIVTLDEQLAQSTTTTTPPTTTRPPATTTTRPPTTTPTTTSTTTTTKPDPGDKKPGKGNQRNNNGNDEDD